MALKEPTYRHVSIPTIVESKKDKRQLIKTTERQLQYTVLKGTKILRVHLHQKWKFHVQE